MSRILPKWLQSAGDAVRRFRLLSVPGLAASAALVLLMAGCMTESQRVSQVLGMRDRGEITDEQALQMLRTSQASPLQAVTKPAATPPAAPVAVASITEPVKAPAKSGYQPQSQVRGRVRSIGSDTVGPIMEVWAESFKKYHPGFRFDGEHKGSSTAAPAIAEGQAEFGPMSRKLKDKERTMLQSQLGHEPVVIRVALDTIAVYVHPSNPIAKRGLTFAQIDAIFGAERKRGHAEITRWGQLGLTGAWANAPIHVFSRNSASGTYAYFQKAVMSKGAYRSTNNELAGSELLVQAVANDPYAIGYSGIGYRTDAVAVAPLAKEAGNAFVPPEAKYAYSEEYPLARYLYVVVGIKPGTAITGAHKEFLTYAYSSEGQAEVAKMGFFPLSSEVIAEELGKLGL